MAGKVKKVLFFLVYISGFAKILRYIKQKNTVTILLLHNIEFSKADKLLKRLSQKYNFISLTDYMIFIQGKYIEPNILKNSYNAILTFDDGYKENYELLPLFEKYKLPTTIFICSSIVGTNKHFWSTYHSDIISMKEVKSKSHKEMMLHFNNLGYYRNKIYDLRQSLSLYELNKMINSGIVDFQAHTKYHPILTKLDDESAYEEIVGSKNEIESLLNKNIRHFAYPNGNYADREMEYVKKGGFESGLTVDFGYNDLDTDIYRLKRICLNDDGSLYENLVKSTGLWDMLKHIKKKIKLPLEKYSK